MHRERENFSTQNTVLARNFWERGGFARDFQKSVRQCAKSGICGIPACRSALANPVQDRPIWDYRRNFWADTQPSTMPRAAYFEGDVQYE